MADMAEKMTLTHRVMYESTNRDLVPGTKSSTRFVNTPAMLKQVRVQVATGKWKNLSFQIWNDGQWVEDKDAMALFHASKVTSKVKRTHEHAVSPLLELNQLTGDLFRQAAKRELTPQELTELTETSIVALKASGVTLEEIANMATHHYEIEAREMLSDEPETSTIA